MKKRLFGILLSFAMMLTMMPVLGLSQTAYADVDVIHVGSTYQSGGEINFGPEEVWIIAGNSPSRYTGSWNLDYIEYNQDSQHHFTLSTEDQTFDLYLPDEDNRPPWGVAVTGGNGTSSKPFILKVLHEEPVSYNCWVGGTRVTSANKEDVFNDGKVRFAPAEGDNPATLTLKEYTYNDEGCHIEGIINGYFGIFFGDPENIGKGEPLTVVLEGDNSITCTGDAPEADYLGICTTGDITFKGNGNLTASGKYCGIDSRNGGIEIKGSGDITASGEIVGVSAENDITIGENAGNITISASGEESTGVWAKGSVGLAVNGGSVHVGASGEGSVGVKVSDSNAKLTIGEKTKSFISSGTEAAVRGSVVNAIAGTGWTDTAGTQGKADIAINSEGQKLETYKKVQFPAVPEPVKESTITYDLNGGTWDGKTGIVTQTVNNGTVITLPKPTRDGYTFDYWEGSKYYAGDKYKVNGDHTFKAVWKTADKGGGSDSDNKGGSSRKGVNTGDEQNVVGWITMMIASVLALAALAVKRKDILHR